LEPTLKPEQRRSVIAYLYSLDLDRKGNISFTQLMKYMSRAPAAASLVSTADGHLADGAAAEATRRGASNAHSTPLQRSCNVKAAVERDVDHGSLDGRSKWRLRELHVDRSTYLVDDNTLRVYSKPSSSSDWPHPIGNWNQNTGEIESASSSVAVQLFRTLDGYLKEREVHFSELFGRFDKGSKGWLSDYELGLLIQNLMPQVTQGDLKYLAVRAKVILMSCVSS
jgi:hypothetical protein